MYATVFHSQLRALASDGERITDGRSLARALSAVAGFVAFVALEGSDDEIVGLCICEDSASLDEAQTIATEWHKAYASPAGSGIQEVTQGRVIVQLGL